MSLEVHRRAEVLMGRADGMAREGRTTEAQALYRLAALEEAAAFDLIPSNRLKTRGVIAVSTVALFRKGHGLEEAIRQAHHYLALDDLPEFARADLEDLLDELRTEQVAEKSARILGPDTFEWVLKGRGVGYGFAPLSIVGQQIDRVAKYGMRVYEYLAGLPLRSHGPPPREAQRAFDILISEPAAGSYRFSIRFSLRGQQLPLFDSVEPVAADRLGRTFGEILERACSPDPARLAESVEDPSYRDAFLRLVRTLTPDGKQLSEIQVRHIAETTSSTLLTPPLRSEITNRLASSREPTKEEENEVIDVLRGLQLNRGWIVLGKLGEERRCYVGKDLVLEDVVGPLVNRRVKVTGHVHRTRFMIHDIVEAEDEDQEPFEVGSGS